MEKVVFKTNLTIFEYRRDSIYMSQRHSKLAINQTGPFGKIQQREIAYFNLVCDGTLGGTVDFASTLSNVNNNVKISNLLEFLVMLLFSSHCSHPIIICRKLHNYENIHWRDSFSITSKNLWQKSFFPFHLQFCKNILEWLFPMNLPLASR